MPIGVPKVPFRNPGEDDISWIDVYNRLYRERLLFLGQEVESEISNQLIGLMIYLSIEDENKDLYFFINSPGGWVLPGIAIYDTMQFVPPEVHTICLGLAASMGSFILVGGTITKRLAFPHARVMIHQPAAAFYEAQAGEFVMEAEELLKLREIITKVYVQRTGKPLWVVSEDLERDVFMSATEAQTHGIVDLVAVQ
ncbi:ATP-dependent Clp protease proteolytic subunit (chloroplast) [Vitis riparia]|uniref:ATP-dependent Clp protease proteolytic subunit n=36 Tax=Vitis TaxID=3603 RepID=CLPP_VITVI|nr:ATP-dependent Clp protease proteolytic subunit [Vitis rotundifolia]YP_009235368.1 clp protease proteolytic subunit [Vitis aestivalis]YP_009306963.1 ATP-dependent Clp protease proteolytic subunit [Vitis amurensis]YP_009428200.1 ATP-dependent Clp protease proteolytic subunit [Vitis acerifolia]YP_009433129.1 clp protease proteolytic subunit [Vitis mustangensis]YP_009437787.1 clp protease proteolytic subunit [Vitis x champinii]YP_009442930.1 clp protease proteolytic subunit [Vitis cinerea]YP_|eukprot:YP_567102.1 ATP-dependent Clp protease proteolytic subunit (chloroplast) [Vitis vinifera]